MLIKIVIKIRGKSVIVYTSSTLVQAAGNPALIGVIKPTANP